ncbi:hypothetical protein MRB53_011116 [Persea americana]|uniref:Uncharacterized protein n=1 Tax=Persea americana TaxID=3435 RepID=A0ACC2LTV4_PERAE|nr:hypothetical protein MRB53_011116 [Persea americana]
MAMWRGKAGLSLGKPKLDPIDISTDPCPPQVLPIKVTGRVGVNDSSKEWRVVHACIRWDGGKGLGSSRSGRADPVIARNIKLDNLGLGVEHPGVVTPDDDNYEHYKKRMIT